MIKRPFEQWIFEEVEMAFDLKRFENMPSLQKWLYVSENERNELPASVEYLRVSLLRNVRTWNEDELKMLFIAPFLIHFGFNNAPHYRVFTQRQMKLKTDKVEATGKVEWMVATGQQIPRKPFFFLQEYKPEKSAQSDPLGQLLIAMVDAQLRNDNPQKPIYGCYTLGGFWFFVLLEDRQYDVSRAYDASRKEDIQDMIVILERVHQYIEKELKISKK